MKSAKSMHTSVWIAQDIRESRVPRLNVHTNRILVHTFSHGTLDSVSVSMETTTDGHAIVPSEGHG